MPVYNSDRMVTGCTMLINKLNGSPFNENDANIIEVSAMLIIFILMELSKLLLIQ